MRTSALAPLALAAALLLTIGGCAAVDDSSSGDDTSQSSSDDDDDDGAPAEETDDSGSSDLVPVLTNEPAAGGPQMVLSASGFDPAELTISSGEVVTFSTEEGIYGLIVNNLDSVTVASSLPEYYQFNDVGTYYLSEDITGNTATITVE